MKVGNKSKKNDNRRHSDESGPTTDSKSAACDVQQSESAQAVGGSDSDTERGTDEVATLRTEAEQWKDKYLRAKAEQQNAIRRAENENRDSIRYANADLLRSVLEILDDLDRTIEAAAQNDQQDVLLDGVRLIQGKVQKLLSDNGVSVIDAVGQPFDPALHEALMQQPSSDHDAGTVIQQVQTGYMHRDRVLRPAKVIVATAPPGQGDTESESAE